MSDLHLGLLSANSLFNDGTDTIEGLPGKDTVCAVEGQSEVIVRAACRDRASSSTRGWAP